MTQFDPVEGNPYRSPAGEAVAAEVAARPRFRVLAVVVGTAVDVVVSLVVGTVMGIAFAATHMTRGMTQQQLERMFVESEAIQVAGFVVGVLSTVLGGYIAAWMGKGLPMRHALGVGLIGLLWGGLGIVLFPASCPVWQMVVTPIVIIPAALLGGWLRAAQDKGKARRSARS